MWDSGSKSNHVSFKTTSWPWLCAQLFCLSRMKLTVGRRMSFFLTAKNSSKYFYKPSSNKQVANCFHLISGNVQKRHTESNLLPRKQSYTSFTTRKQPKNDCIPWHRANTRKLSSPSLSPPSAPTQSVAFQTIHRDKKGENNTLRTLLQGYITFSATIVWSIVPKLFKHLFKLSSCYWFRMLPRLWLSYFLSIFCKR